MKPARFLNSQYSLLTVDDQDQLTGCKRATLDNQGDEPHIPQVGHFREDCCSTNPRCPPRFRDRSRARVIMLTLDHGDPAGRADFVGNTKARKNSVILRRKPDQRRGGLNNADLRIQVL